MLKFLKLKSSMAGKGMYSEGPMDPIAVLKAMQQPKKNPRGVPYDPDAAVATSMKDGTMHEWALCELKVVSRTYGLCVHRNEAHVWARCLGHIASK